MIGKLVRSNRGGNERLRMGIIIFYTKEVLSDGFMTPWAHVLWSGLDTGAVTLERTAPVWLDTIDRIYERAEELNNEAR